MQTRSLDFLKCIILFLLLFSASFLVSNSAHAQKPGAYFWGDADGDGTIGFNDLSALITALGSDESNDKTIYDTIPRTRNVQDLDGNGVIGGNDLSLLMGWIGGRWNRSGRPSKLLLEGATYRIFGGSSVKLEAHAKSSSDALCPGWGVIFAVDAASDCSADIYGYDPAGGPLVYAWHANKAYNYTGKVSLGGIATVRVRPSAGCVDGDSIVIDAYIPSDAESGADGQRCPSDINADAPVRFTISVSSVCGNGVCDSGEKFSNCPEDCLCESDTSEITFVDPGLEGAIRNVISKPTGPILQNELCGLTMLYADSANISGLSGIEHCPALTYLEIYSNQITDLSPLASLTHLWMLSLDSNKISDISALVNNHGLGNGDYLGLDDNLLDLGDCPDLAKLRARGVTVWDDVGCPVCGNCACESGEDSSSCWSDCVCQNDSSEVSFPDPMLQARVRSAIGKPSGPILQNELCGLTVLSAEGYGITDLTGLEHCRALIELYFWDNLISDISPLSSLANLKYLDLEHNQVSDASPLAGLINLTNLYIWYNQISNISALSGLTNLSYLGISGNQVSDISSVSGMVNLIRLYANYNQISDLTPLYSLTNLEFLGLDDNQISDISTLSRLTNLGILYLEDNYVSDLSPLSSLANLSSIYISNNLVSDISGLVNNTALGEDDYVDLTNNPLDVGDCPDIETLIARWVEVDHDLTCP